jgi:peroxiredoxin
VGRPVPDVDLYYTATDGVSLVRLSRRFPLLICFYPALAGPENNPNLLRARAWSQQRAVLRAIGCRLIGVVSEPLELMQARTRTLEAGDRLSEACVFFSDADVELAHHLPLWTTQAGARLVYEPSTIFAHRNHIVRAFYPSRVNDAQIVTSWVRRNV